MLKEIDTIPIFLICDDNYAAYMATMMASVCKNTKHFINFHVLGKGISPKNKRLIEQMRQIFSNFNIDYRDIDIETDYNISYLSLGRMTPSTFIRMLLPDLYPQVEKALVMDVDIISLQDIELLWNQNLNEYIWAAALDQPDDAAIIFKKNMDVKINCKYANCGIMIIDCKRWREEKISSKCLEIERQYRDKLNCADQDVINKVFLGNFKELDSSFNSLLGNEDNIVNRHFCYLRKPWFSKYNIEGDLIKNFEDWWKYAKMTPFYDELKITYDKMANSGKNLSASNTQRNYKCMEMISCVRNLLKKKELQKDKISVIIPVYNVQDYLEKCLDSICGQTYQNLEIICVDDCSTDNSLTILNGYAARDNRIRIVQRSENGGQAVARQTGIDIATGDYIGFVDSDDWIDPDYYKKMLDQAFQNKVDIVVNGSISVHEGEKIYAKNFPGHKQLEQKIYENPSKIMDKFYCVAWNKLFRMDFLKKRQYTIPVRNAHEDVFFHYTTFALAKSVSFFYGPAYHYLCRDTSVSNTGHDWGVEHIKVYSLIFDFYRDNNLLDKKIKLYSTMPFFIIKNEDMFKEYKKYFSKIINYLDQNNEIFNPLDLFFIKSVQECQNYVEYASKYHGTPLASFLRRKK